MPLTITTYHTFVANTKARANQVNTNFSNHRGTLLPIEEDTQAAADAAHDLGTTEYAWRIGYINYVVSDTITTNTIEFPALTTTGAKITLESTTVGSLDIKFDGSTGVSFDATGISRSIIGGWTISGLTVGALAMSAETTGSVSIYTTAAQTICTVQIKVSGNKPVLLSFIDTTTFSSGYGYFSFGTIATATSYGNSDAKIKIRRSGDTFDGGYLISGGKPNSITQTGQFISSSAIRHIDRDPVSYGSETTLTYECIVTGFTHSAQSSAARLFFNIQMLAYEIT